MEAAKTQDLSSVLPEEIRTLPQVEVPVAGVKGFSLSDDQKQVVFFIFDEGVTIPDHSHCDQRGVLVSGEMVLEINGQTNLFQPGDVYHVPEGVKHRTSFSKRTVLIDMSDKPDRYKVHE